MRGSGTICPYCHTSILPGQAHACPVIMTGSPIEADGKLHDVIDLVRSFTVAQGRLAELEREKAVLERALRLACADVLYPQVGTEDMAETRIRARVATYMEQARQEAPDG